MLFIILVALIYAALTAFSASFLASLSVPIFFIGLYMLPIIINLLFTKLQKNEKYKLINTILFPTMSLVFYMLFAYITSKTGAWSEFVNTNTLVDGDITVDIAKNLFSSSQVVFVVLIYYVSSLAYYVLSKVTKKKEMKGVKYA